MSNNSTLNQGNLSDLRGTLRLAVDATVGVTDVVEKLHHTIQKGHLPLGRSRAGQAAGIAGLVYRGIRGTTRLVGHGVDAGLAQYKSVLPGSTPTIKRDAFVSVMNGLYGDHLVESGNPLAIDMDIRFSGQPLDPGDPEMGLAIGDHSNLTEKIMVFAHGLCLNDNHWTNEGINQGSELAGELGYTPVYLRYNTGLPVHVNGKKFAQLLEKITHQWPGRPSEIVIIGHSMGGLVSRSACHHGTKCSHDWTTLLRHMACIGSPHHGAPLERAGQWAEYVLGLSPYALPFTRLTGKRSAGIGDLRQGQITDKQGEFVPLPENVECYAMASVLANERTPLRESLIGDGLVTVSSALGRGGKHFQSLGIPETHQWLGSNVGHLELLNCTAVYNQLRGWLEPTATGYRLG